MVQGLSLTGEHLMGKAEEAGIHIEEAAEINARHGIEGGIQIDPAILACKIGLQEGVIDRLGTPQKLGLIVFGHESEAIHRKGRNAQTSEHLNRQGGDVGTRYRTGIYYTSPDERPVILAVYDRIASGYSAPLVVELMPLRNFYAAEEYHQDYLDKNPGGYCHIPYSLIEFARSANSGE
jgi:hypothetical protein